MHNSKCGHTRVLVRLDDAEQAVEVGAQLQRGVAEDAGGLREGAVDERGVAAQPTRVQERRAGQRRCGRDVCVSPEEGERAAKAMRASAYVECSARPVAPCGDLFDALEAAWAIEDKATRRRAPQRKNEGQRDV